MQPGPFPMANGGPGIAYPPPRPSSLRKAGGIVGAVLTVIGGLLIWAGYMWLWVFTRIGGPGQKGTIRLILGLILRGASMGFGGRLLAGFATSKDGGHQKIGLFVLSAVFVFTMTNVFIPYCGFP